MIHKAGQLGWFCFEVFAAITYPATLIILGLKASTCFRRVFIVFPVPTMACEGEERETGLRKQEIGKIAEMQTKKNTGVQVKRKKLVMLYLCYVTIYAHSLKITRLA